MTTEMKNYEIKVNAICPMPKDLFALGFTNLMKEIIIEEKNKIDSEFKQVDHEKCTYKGSRFSDNNHLTRVALAAIFDSIKCYHWREENLEYEDAWDKAVEATNDWITNQSEVSELRRIAKDTIIYSMESDHWYTFEKDWGQ